MNYSCSSSVTEEKENKYGIKGPVYTVRERSYVLWAKQINDERKIIDKNKFFSEKLRTFSPEGILIEEHENKGKNQNLGNSESHTYLTDEGIRITEEEKQIDSKGNVTSTFTKFDNKDRWIYHVQERKDVDGEWEKTTYVYKYDDSNMTESRVIKREYSDKDSEEETKKYRQDVFDDDDNLIKSYDEENKISSEYKYENGKEISRRFYIEGKLSEREERKYDDNNNIIEDVQYDGEGKINFAEYHKYEYDGDKIVSEKINYRYENEDLYLKEEHSFSEDRLTETITEYNPDGEINETKIYKYNEGGDRISIHYVRSSSSSPTKDIFEDRKYDKYGNLTFYSEIWKNSDGTISEGCVDTYEYKYYNDSAFIPEVAFPEIYLKKEGNSDEDILFSGTFTPDAYCISTISGHQFENGDPSPKTVEVYKDHALINGMLAGLLEDESTGDYNVYFICSSQMCESKLYVRKDYQDIYQLDTWNTQYAQGPYRITFHSDGSNACGGDNPQIGEIPSGSDSEQSGGEEEPYSQQCRVCGGSGDCKHCGGTGRITDYGPLSISTKEPYEQKCPYCDRGKCRGCKGSGRI